MPHVRVHDGKIQTLKLEYNIVAHCNFACEECSHLSPFMRREESSLDRFRADIAALAPIMDVYRFRFLGGEPLLHRGLADHIDVVRASGMAQEIQVYSNGSLIDRIDDALLDRIDHLVLSWYPDPSCDPEKLRALTARFEGRRNRLSVLHTDSFRRMTIGPSNESDALVDDIFRGCAIAHTAYCQTFYDGQFYLCSRPLYMQEFLRRAGEPAPDFRLLDGTPIHAPDLRERLAARYGSPVPLASCRHCLGTYGRDEPWRQLSPAERKAPAAPPRFTPDLVTLPGPMRRLRRRVTRLGRAGLLYLPKRVAKRAIGAVERIVR